MTSFPNSPRLIKGGIVVVNPETSAVIRIIPLQYNPDSLTRTLQTKTGTSDIANRSGALQFSGPPVETIRVEIELDAADQLEKGEQVAIESGIQAQLYALEMLIYPTTQQLRNQYAQARLGILEILPMEGNLTLFIWNKHRTIPVRITDFNITEEAFDANLNPIRARISLSMQVLSVDDLGFRHSGGSLYLNYQENKEKLSGNFSSGILKDLGIVNIL